MRRLILSLLLGVSACETTSVVADISQDKVVIRGTVPNFDEAPIYAQATQACALYKRHAIPLTKQCLDQWCLNRAYLFACIKQENDNA